MPKAQTDDASIREQAYYFWEQDGRPEGRETEYWMRAQVAVSEKAQLDTLTQPPPKATAKTKASKSKAEPVKAEKVPKKKPKAK